MLNARKSLNFILVFVKERSRWSPLTMNLFIPFVGIIFMCSLCESSMELESVVSPNFITALNAFNRSSHNLMEIGKEYFSNSARQLLIFPDPIALISALFQRFLEFFFGVSSPDVPAKTTTTTTTVATTSKYQAIYPRTIYSPVSLMIFTVL